MCLNTDLSEVCAGHQANISLLVESCWLKVNGQALVLLEVVPLKENIRLIGQDRKQDTILPCKKKQRKNTF